MSAAEVLDSHHHLWDTNALDYALFRSVGALNRPFLLGDYDAEAAAVGVSQAICVEAASAGADGRRETEWLLREIDHSPRVAALIAWAPLELPELDTHLAWLSILRGKPIVGVRRSFEFEPSDFPLRQSVIAGARTAGENNLVVDLVMFSESLAATVMLVDACPGTEFVLDHLGKPPIREGKRRPWWDLIYELAQRPNVSAKLSGLATECDHASWTRDQIAPYLEHALDCFGPERLLYGSDWPVVNLAGGHRRWLAAVASLLAGIPASERSAIFSGNARRVYRL